MSQEAKDSLLKLASDISSVISDNEKQKSHIAWLTEMLVCAINATDTGVLKVSESRGNYSEMFDNGEFYFSHGMNGLSIVLTKKEENE